MAVFSMRVQVIKRSSGRSVIAAAAYRAGEKLHDQRQDMTHDYSYRTDVQRTEFVLPANAPNWVQGAMDRETFWNRVDAAEKRKDAQTARELRVMIPRELDGAERIRVVRDFVCENFVAKGMVADICWHNSPASDGGENCHAHVMLTMRPLTPEGFGPKVRHDWVPDPEGRKHPDGRPVMVVSNEASWNSNEFYESCREAWETIANEALARAGSEARIDRRSFLERGISRLPEPALRLAHHLNDLYGTMRERFGQFQMARHYRAVESRAKDAFAQLANDSPAPAEATRITDRFFGWFERQVERLGPAPRTEPKLPEHGNEMER